MYKNRSCRKIDSRRLLSREYDIRKTFSLTENPFSGKTYSYTIRPWGCSTSGSGSVSFSETLGREEPNVKKPPLWACACCRGAGAGRNWALGAGTGALGAGTGALEATTGALGAATGALEAGALAAGAGWAGAGAGAGILCLALAADPKVCASSKKVLPPFVVLVGMFGMEMGTKGLVVAGLN